MLAATHYWADPFLANLDRALFGTDPWRLFISFNGPIIDRAYVTWLPVKFILLVALVCAPESPTKARALLSYFLIMLTGSIGQYALPSAGPLFHQPVPLNQWVADSRDYLWQAYETGHGRVGSGISAMPSMHVAIAMWMALVVRSYVPKLAVLGLGYLVLIFIGSIALGWHYATDSIAAVGIALLAWNISAVSAARLERRRTALAS
jgi:membrane-associated phospholipid phosphatase